MSANYSFCVGGVTNGITDDFINATSVRINGTALNTGDGATPVGVLAPVSTFPELIHPQRLLFTVDRLDPRVSHSLTVFNPTPQNVITIDAVVVDVANDTGTSSLIPNIENMTSSPSNPAEWRTPYSDTGLHLVPDIITSITDVNPNVLTVIGVYHPILGRLPRFVLRSPYSHIIPQLFASGSHFHTSIPICHFRG